MDRTSLRAALLAVAALLVIGCSAASAAASTPEPEGSTMALEQSPTDGAAAPTGLDDAVGDAGAEDAEEVSTTSAQEVPAPEEPASEEPAAQGQEEVVPPPPGEDAPAEPPPAPPAESPPAPTSSDPPPSSTAVFTAPGTEEGAQGRPPAQPTGGAQPETDQPVTTSSVPILPPAELVAPEHGAARASQSRADKATGVERPPPVVERLVPEVERLVPEVERRLDSVQTQMKDMQTSLDNGQLPATDRLVELRSSLQRIAPVLLALDRGLAAAGQLSPRLRALLRHVRSHLAGTHVSAASLIEALRRSGARGREFQLLLRQLVGFRALRDVLGVRLDAAPAPSPPLPVGVEPAYLEGQPSPVAAPPPPAAAPPERPSAARRATEAPVRGGVDPSAPTRSAGGSATASAAGAFSAAGAALVAALLIGLALPRLRARLELAPSRRYAVAFLAPLERPG